jgi:predicted DsbA family dithiol-disulfide isomerase
LGSESALASRAAECANEQGRFWEYYGELFQNQRGENKGAFSTANLTRFAERIGLDADSFSQCLASGRYRDSVETETQAALGRGVTTVPTFIVGDQVIKGAVPYAEIEAAIEAELVKQGGEK